jgi:hypothetical protein
VTMVAIHSLIDEHLFIGMLLIGPLALKLASVGYRFARFRAGSPGYRERGAPANTGETVISPHFRCGMSPP